MVAARGPSVGLDFEDWLRDGEVALRRTAHLLTGNVHSAQDLVQNTLARLYQRWDRVPDFDHVDAHARRLLVDELRTAWRRPGRRGEVFREVVLDRRAPLPPSYDGSLDAVWNHVCSLPSTQRIVVVLSFHEQLTDAEIADLMGTSVDTVTSQRSDALTSLRASPLDHPEVSDGDLVTRTLTQVVTTTEYPTPSMATVVARSGALVRARRRATALVAAATAVVVAGGWGVVVRHDHGHATTPSPTGHLAAARSLVDLPQGAAPQVDYLDGNAYVTASGARVTAPAFRTATTATTFGDGVLVAGRTTTQRPFAVISLVSGGSTHRLGCGTPAFALGSGDPAYWLSQGCRFVGPGRLFHGTTIVRTSKGVIYSPVGSTSTGLVADGTLVLARSAAANGPVLIGPDGAPSSIPRVAAVAAVSPSGDLAVGINSRGNDMVIELSTGAVQWRAGLWTLGHFSASGRYVVAMQNRGAQSTHGVGDVVQIRDAATGHRVMSSVLPHLSMVGRPVWEGDRSVLVVAEDRQGQQAIVRVGVDGTITRATRAAPAAEGTFRLAATPDRAGSGTIATFPGSPASWWRDLGGTMDQPADRAATGAPTGALAMASRSTDTDADFAAYLAARQASLLRTAYLLTGNRHDAEDLTQTAFAKLYLSWDKVRDRGAIDGYVRRILVNEHNSLWRRAWKRREHAQDHTTFGGLDEAVHDEYDDGHGTELWQLVQSLPRKARAVVVLRYYEELSEAETAHALGISVGTVKSQTSRALAALRERTPQTMNPRSTEENDR